MNFKELFKNFFTNETFYQNHRKGYIPIERKPDPGRIKYISEAKLERDLDIPAEKDGIGFGVAGAGSFSKTAHKNSLNERIFQASQSLENKNLLIEDAVPQEKKYFLTRFIGRAGSAWAWAEGGSDYIDTAWWIGRNDNLQIMAYGHRNNLMAGMIPIPKPSDKSTWWPSRFEAYAPLLKDINVAVNAVDERKQLEKYNSSDFAQLLNPMFLATAYNEESLTQAGVYMKRFFVWIKCTRIKTPAK